nr:uncharacterized protein LOC117865625 [Setaria viridis]
MYLLIPTPVHIVQLALEFKKLVETVKENKDECRKIGICAHLAGKLLVKHEERRPEMMQDPTMQMVLREIKNCHEIARRLVNSQESEGMLPSCLQARKIAKQLRTAMDDIDSNMILLLEAITILDEGQQQQVRDVNTVMKILNDEGKRFRDLVSISTENLEEERQQVRDLVNKAVEICQKGSTSTNYICQKNTHIFSTLKVHH